MTTLQPDNSTSLERIYEDVLARTDLIPVPIATIKIPHQTDPRVLAALGWEFSVNEWQSSWDDQRKRDVVDASPAIHRKLGVTATVREAIAALGYSVTMEEWFQYAGDPYTFRVAVNLDVETLTIPDFLMLQRVALDTKNVRSFFQGFSATRQQAGSISYGIGLGGTIDRTFQPPEKPIYEYRAIIGTGIGQVPAEISSVFDPLD